MREPQLITSKTELPIDEIGLHGRLRPVSEAGVATIVASIREIGQLTSPVVVRQLRRDGELVYRVLDGAHRLAAARELGWQTVPVRVFDCTDDQARLMEIDGNLAGAELDPLDTAVFLATRKAVYERMHPETRAHVAGGLARQGSASELGSFADVTAQKFGLTPRQVQKIVAAGSRLQPDEIKALRLAPKAVTLKDLQVIAKSTPTDRYFIVEMLADGRAKSAADALRQSREAPAALADADLKYSRLLDAWGRASIETRRRFVQEMWAEMAGLMRDLAAEAGDREA